MNAAGVIFKFSVVDRATRPLLGLAIAFMLMGVEHAAARQLPPHVQS